MSYQTIPQPFIDDLIARSDIVELIESRVPLKSAGHNLKGLCPFHQEKSPSFTVSATKQFYYCFGCHASGNAIGFLMAYDRLSFVEAVEYLAKQQGVSLPKEYSSNTHYEKQNVDHYELMKEVMQFYCQQLKQHPQKERVINYLKNRGLTGEVCKQFAIGYAPENWDGLLKKFNSKRDELLATGMLIEKNNSYYDRFRDRIMFPIRDKRGRVIAFGGRILDKGEPKYLNSPETALFHKGSELYGLYEAMQAQRQFEYMIVVEGYMDVVALAQYGITATVATMGTALTPKQFTRLFRLSKEVILCFDGDDAGRNAAWRALETSLSLLSDEYSLKFIFLPKGYDPDSYVRELGTQAFLQQLKKSTPFSEFFIKHLLAQVDTSYVSGQARLVSLAAPLLAQLPKGVLREMLIEQLMPYTRLDRARLLQAIFPNESTVKKIAPVKVKTGGLSPVDRAVCLLLQQTEVVSLATKVDDLAVLPYANTGLLIELVQLLKDEPGLSIGAILAHFGQEGQQELAALAAKPLLLTNNEAIALEFSDVINKLHQEVSQVHLGQLLAKIRKDDLSQLNAEDRSKIHELLRKDEEI
ncbi:MAG: DNA primase [Gammaproteobacteria bacterium]|jgi:DNA primase